MMKSKLPQIKKEINAFLLGEEGKISKRSLLATGVFLSSAALSGVILAEVGSATHSNDLDLPSDYTPGSSITATHTHSTATGTGTGTGTSLI